MGNSTSSKISNTNIRESTPSAEANVQSQLLVEKRSKAPILPRERSKPSLELTDQSMSTISVGQEEIPVIDVLSQYEVMKELGDSKTSSLVYEVRHKTTNERFALKQFPKSEEGQELLAIEYHGLSQFCDQGIISAVDYFADANALYLLLELGDKDLFDRIREGCFVREEVAKKIIRKLLETVNVMHKFNCVHRDIKPENIVFVSKNSEQPKLIDFGSFTEVCDLQLYDELAGTPHYLAPERWRYHYGWEMKASEIWAIGVIAFEMLTQRRCFGGDSVRAIRKSIRNGEWAFPKHTKLSRSCQDFITRLLAMDCRHRLTPEAALRHPWLS